MYRCKHNFTYAESKFFKGEVYKDFPNGKGWMFEELETPKVEKKVSGEVVETAAIKPKTEKRKRK